MEASPWHVSSTVKRLNQLSVTTAQDMFGNYHSTTQLNGQVVVSVVVVVVVVNKRIKDPQKHNYLIVDLSWLFLEFHFYILLTQCIV